MRNGDFTQSLYLKQAQSCAFAEQEELKIANSMGLPIDNDGYTYGYVFFRQQQDISVRRGFFQKALVLLTPHSWPGLFSQIIAILGPFVMNSVSKSQSRSNVDELLEAACFEIAAWYENLTLGHLHQVLGPLKFLFNLLVSRLNS
jgi:hypothetical protein